MFSGSAGESMKMRNKRHRDNFIEADGFIKQGKELVLIVIKFILLSWWIPVRSCFILQQKEFRIYVGSGVSQTPIAYGLKGEKDVN